MPNFSTHIHRLLADTFTPVGVYLTLRDRFADTILLESSEYGSRENSFSFLCFQSLLAFQVKEGRISIRGDDLELYPDLTVPEALDAFMDSIRLTGEPLGLKFNGIFGYTGFEAVKHFDTLQPNSAKPGDGIPEMQYNFFRYILVFNHFKQEAYLVENVPNGETAQPEKILTLLERPIPAKFGFERTGEEQTDLSGEEFKSLVDRCKKHCKRGDVFQMVISRKFRQQFQGDEFNVYRALRSINPSPYLFYFDYGSYKIFGSSPEAQLRVQDGIAQIHPIAGTYPRSGEDAIDKARALELAADPKENAEHVMLVDLARNDLARNTQSVKVSRFREVQYFSHVLHLVSQVEGVLPPEQSAVQIFADSFPAGTLSGAPKYRALELIDEMEPVKRGFYGGAIGYFGFDGNLNHAILIRSFLSKGGELHYQAGAGIVIDSQPEKELKEVDHKLAALKRALEMAEGI